MATTSLPNRYRGRVRGTSIGVNDSDKIKIESQRAKMAAFCSESPEYPHFAKPQIALGAVISASLDIFALIYDHFEDLEELKAHLETLSE